MLTDVLDFSFQTQVVICPEHDPQATFLLSEISGHNKWLRLKEKQEQFSQAKAAADLPELRGLAGAMIM
jgi:hypothetical protein